MPPARDQPRPPARPWRRSAALAALVALASLAAVGPRAAPAQAPAPAPPAAPPAPAALPPWSPGTLDLHQISTGEGNAALFVLPDSTTLLVDAGDAGGRVPGAPPVPDCSRRAGEWIARYVLHMLAGSPSPRLDYALLTHFHSDHMGSAGPEAPRSPAGGYGLSGITDVAEGLPIGTLIDRGWPDYSYPAPLTGAGIAAMDNYLAFLLWQREHRGLTVERARPGAADQVRLLRDPEIYPGFEVRVVAVNGEVWTGDGAATERRFPALAGVPRADRPGENMCSIALQMRYGPFSYYTGGDLPGVPDDGAPAWWDVETPVARALGPTDVVVVDHHGSIDPASPFFLATTRPRVLILPTWAPGHPAPVVLKRLLNERIYPGPRDLFATRIRPSTREVIGPRIERLAADHGHLVVRVEPGGGSYRVFVLDDEDASYRVLAVYGPYSAE